MLGSILQNLKKQIGMKINYLIIALVILLGFESCEKIDPNNLEETGFTHGVFITNEGGYGNSNGSISYLDPDSMKVQNNLFYQVNNRPLGDVVQSVTIHGNRAYIVVNNSQKVEVVDLETFSSIGLIQGLSYPRYFLGIDDHKAYISNGAMQGKVYVVDLDVLLVVDSIAVGFGPEQMILNDGKVYVANSGGWASDNTISVIDSSKDDLLETIQVGDNPISMVMDSNDDLWILCKGNIVWGADYSIVEETASELIRLDIRSKEIETRMIIGSTGDYFSPTRLAVSADNDKILFAESGGIYEIDLDASIQPLNALISGNFYGFGVDPESGTIYSLPAGNFTEAGFLHRFNSEGAKIDSLLVGIAPNGVVFN